MIACVAFVVSIVMLKSTLFFGIKSIVLLEHNTCPWFLEGISVLIAERFRI